MTQIHTSCTFSSCKHQNINYWGANNNNEVSNVVVAYIICINASVFYMMCKNPDSFLCPLADHSTQTFHISLRKKNIKVFSQAKFSLNSRNISTLVLLVHKINQIQFIWMCNMYYFSVIYNNALKFNSCWNTSAVR